MLTFGVKYGKLYPVSERKNNMPRKQTNRLLEMIENEEISKDTVIMACVKYMSEADVADMMEANEIELVLDIQAKM